MDGWVGGLIGRQAGRQTDRQTDRQTLFEKVTTKHAVLQFVAYAGKGPFSTAYQNNVQV